MGVGYGTLLHISWKNFDVNVFAYFHVETTLKA